MPKIISAEEHELNKSALNQACIDLIKSKGLRRLTVDDLTKAVGMAKGSFYSYYRTKEELLYQTIKAASRKMLEAMMNLSRAEGNFRENVEKALYDIYLAPDSIVLHISKVDAAHLMRKLPTEKREQEVVNGQDNLAMSGEFFGIPEKDRGTLAYLMDALSGLASVEKSHGKDNHEQALKFMVKAIVDFLDEKSTKKGHMNEKNCASVRDADTRYLHVDAFYHSNNLSKE